MVSMAEFRRKAAEAIADERMQGALERATAKFRAGREQALTELPDADALRDHFKAVRAATLAQLAEHLETFERQALAAGAQVHWCETAAEAAQLITSLAKQHGAHLAVKSKSMTTEEIHLNQALAVAGVRPVETDLGEWIIQLANEPPSHIIGPAIHKTREQVADLFSREVGRPLPPDDVAMLTAEARRLLREKFLAAGIGISGVNVAVAETGSIVLVTNEGNGRMVTSVPPVHVAVMGIEKIVPTWQDAAAWLALLARSATGQPMSIYTSVITGPARPHDPDGPREVHIIILDNGRSRALTSPFEEALQCIRCGACLNVCPVYREAGGHAYGNPYSGPIGTIVAPLLFGVETMSALPQASTLCGACLDVCPARIDIPRMLLEWRAAEVEQRLLPWYERVAERLAAWVLAHPRLLAWGRRFLWWGLRPWERNGVLRLPRRWHPAGERALPALASQSFRDWWREKG
nr:lactate utilization protein B [Ardenticatena sp.]